MQNPIERNPKHGGIWRFVARFWGTLVATYWFIAVLGAAFTEPITEFGGEGAVLGILIVMTTILTVLAWRWEQGAGIFLVISGLALSVFALNTAGRYHLFAMLVSGVPFILSGSLFITTAWMNKKDESA